MEYTASTSTTTSRRKKDIESEIIMEAQELARRKWYQDKRYLIATIKNLGAQLNNGEYN